MQDLVSVIVPVYNVEKYLIKCVDSILGQTYHNIEIILVDDGSTDTSGGLCDRFLAKDKRVKVIHKENGGAADARNVGIEASAGTYFVFVDSDDYISPYMVEKLLYIIKAEKADLCLCGFQAVDKKDNPCSKMTSYDLKEGIYNKEEFFRKSCENGGWNYSSLIWNKIYCKVLFDTVRFEVGKICEDEFIFHHIIDQCKRIAVIEERLYFYRQRKNSVMSEKYTVRRLDAVEAFLLRCLYYKEKKMAYCLSATEKAAFYWLGVGFKNLEYAAAEKRFLEIRTLYRKILLIIILSYRFTIRQKLRRVIFCMNPSIAAVLKDWIWKI